MLKNYALWVVFSAQKWHFWALDTATKGVNRVEKVPKCENPSFFSSFNFVSMRLKPPPSRTYHIPTKQLKVEISHVGALPASEKRPLNVSRHDRHALTFWESSCANGGPGCGAGAGARTGAEVPVWAVWNLVHGSATGTWARAGAGGRTWTRHRGAALPLASASSDMSGWSKVLLSHTVDVARSH